MWGAPPPLGDTALWAHSGPLGRSEGACSAGGRQGHGAGCGLAPLMCQPAAIPSPQGTLPRSFSVAGSRGRWLDHRAAHHQAPAVPSVWGGAWPAAHSPASTLQVGPPRWGTRGGPGPLSVCPQTCRITQRALVLVGGCVGDRRGVTGPRTASWASAQLHLVLPTLQGSVQGPVSAFWTCTRARQPGAGAGHERRKSQTFNCCVIGRFVGFLLLPSPGRKSLPRRRLGEIKPAPAVWLLDRLLWGEGHPALHLGVGAGGPGTHTPCSPGLQAAHPVRRPGPSTDTCPAGLSAGGRSGSPWL